MSKKAMTNAAANGANVKSTPPTQTKTPVPEELSDEDRRKLRQWLDAPNTFRVAAVPLSRKRKRDAPALHVQNDLFEDRLSCQYEVQPVDKWESLRKYKRFTVGSESMSTGQCILVRCDESDDGNVDPQREWKAKVLEVRALDTEHVYLRVAWLNRPEDLASGRKDYHGKNELIPTNQMDIIDGAAVNGTFEIVKWDDSDEGDAVIDEDQYFWRQTFDYVDTRAFSKLRIICVDNAPQNPDEMIIQCSHEDCRKWLHMKCIAERAVQEAAGDITAAKKKTNKKKNSRSVSASTDTTSSAVATAAQGSSTVEVFVKGLPVDPGKSIAPATRTEIVVKRGDGSQRTKEFCCLHCGRVIEDED